MHVASLQGHANAATACACLCRLAPLAGGTRDICSLLEHLACDAIAAARASGVVQPLGDHVLPALVSALGAFLTGGDVDLDAVHAPLAALLTMAAEMLDADLRLVRADAAKAQAVSDKKAGKKKATTESAAAAAAAATSSDELMSTISTFLPHNGRGPSGSTRRLVQSFVELLIWARTSAAPEAAAFVPALEQLTQLATQAGSGSAAEAEEAIHKVTPQQPTPCRDYMQQCRAPSPPSSHTLASF